MPQSCRYINVLSEPPLSAAVAHWIWSLVGHMSHTCAAARCNVPMDLVGQHGVAVWTGHDPMSSQTHEEVQETSFRAGTKRDDIISVGWTCFIQDKSVW
ncbi:hypothetical protein H257_03758 [Aphanomyces astaci]|uniref:Uncharacterized protein n=1 Tax=Aphanomyces astaci TaxID=112090 RepID=W4GY72_APHAT|nr:hypothetical protein H257_03758 [Aphanomyces astaci]ETV84592.1 hypothetical protein H257_03758 [Aphanomyces astaci]|eukprot:XP_009826284.1 hypothetical protein H257_03758 [Aphanomyces astaci]